MRIFVTGGAGFIGSHVCDRALALGHEVVAFDDLSTGRELFLADARGSPRFRLVRGDIRDLDAIRAAATATRPEWIVHLAANADVRYGLENPRKDLDVNTIGTWNVLEAARASGCDRIVFSSTGSVYGEPIVFPTPEDAPFPEQTSLYAASKLAGEGLISAYCHGFGMTGVVFRFVSILGPRYTHGHVFDFVKSLRADRTRLRILGNGRQTKSYLHVADLMDGLWLVIERGSGSTAALRGFRVFNIGHDDALRVDDSVDTITRRLGIAPVREYAGGERGWIGDSPRIQLDTSRLKALGWSARHSLTASVEATVDYLVAHPDLLDRA